MAIIPKEEIDAYERWQLGSFGGAPAKPLPGSSSTATQRPESRSDSAPVLRLPTAEEIEQMHQQAQQEGYQAGVEQGRQAGYEAGMAAARAEAERLAALADNFRHALSGVEQEIADQLLELALEVARQVVRSSLASQPEAILPLIREALTALPLHHGTINIHLHPDDARRLHTQLGNQIGQSGWHLIEDGDVAPGGCLIRAGSSEVDATLPTRWRRVLEAIGLPQDTSPAP